MKYKYVIIFSFSMSFFFGASFSMNRYESAKPVVDVKEKLQNLYKLFLSSLQSFGPIRVYWEAVVYEECKKRCNAFAPKEYFNLSTCASCLEHLKKREFVNGGVWFFSVCGHVFHYECLNKKWREQCSQCRAINNLQRFEYCNVSRLTCLSPLANTVLYKISEFLNKNTNGIKIDKDFWDKDMQKFVRENRQEKYTCSKTLRNVFDILNPFG